ncbi:hypothetical protein FPOAC2_08715 [Fusarium poae]|uniref:hypothetical protein n=1 Tax=Fusarium poae TaxID=36050 RepID=UPI001CE90A93|nr:hypothetical protein FPOAC1_008781 [Fusarium poae]KAG8669386.1 hypothetical protein FPOAC1_008781 [Fusarium poae]
MPQYYPDLLDAGSFRLATISIDIHPYTKVQVPSVTLTTYGLSSGTEITYNALSYTWGSPRPYDTEADAGTSILLNGQTFEVQPNLYDALIELQASCPQTPIWIDALCINQSDPVERCSQVSVMNQIYGKADRVIVWLGKSFPELEAGINAAERIGTESVPHTLQMIQNQYWAFNSDLSIMPDKYGMEPIDEKEALGLLTLFMSNWFARVWVIQEVSLTNDVVILCNGKFTGFDCVGYTAAFLHYSGFFQPCLDLVPKDGPGIHLRGDLYIFHAERIQLLREWCKGHKSQWTRTLETIDFEAGLGVKYEKSAEMVLLRFLFTLFGLQASDPRDVVYGLVGIMKHMAAEDGLVLPSEFEPNYDIDIKDLLRNVAHKIIEATDSLVYITLVKGPDVRETPCLPSWVPDFPAIMTNTLSGAQFRSVGIINSSKHVPHAPNPRPFTIEGNILNVFGFCLGKIKKIGETYIETMQGRRGMSGDILLSMDEVYPYTGQPADEAFWRTLIHDTDFSNRPATLVRLGDFQRAILEEIVHPLRVFHMEADTPSTGEALVLESLREMSYLDDIVARYPSSIFPSLNLVKSCLDFLPQEHVELNDEEIQMLKEPLSRNSMPPGSIMATTYINNRPILTDTGYLGMGLESCEIGDEVWIVAGSPAPLVMRTTDKENEYFVVGESYIHGVMQGEAVTESVAWEKIQMV